MKTFTTEILIIIIFSKKIARDAHMSLKEGKIMPQLPPTTIADGLRMPLKEKTWKII